MQGIIPIHIDINPILKRKLIRKAWKKLTPEEQEKKIEHYVTFFKTNLGLEVIKEKEMWLEKTFEMIRVQREENNIELLKPTEYALRYKRRKDPTAFIDSIFFPTLNEAGSSVRFMMHYLGKELLSSIGIWDLYEDPSFAVVEKEKPQSDKKPKKKTAKKAKPKKNLEKTQKPTAGTTENEDNGSQDDRIERLFSDSHAIDHTKFIRDPPKPNFDYVISGNDDDWIAVDEKKRKALLQKSSKTQALGNSKKLPDHIIIREQPNKQSSKKSKKKNSGQTTKVGTEGFAEDQSVASMAKDKANDQPSSHSILTAKTTEKSQVAMDQEPATHNPELDAQIFSESYRSDCNTEIRSSVASIESDSNNPNTDMIAEPQGIISGETSVPLASQKVSKLRPPAKSKPFMHLETNNLVPIPSPTDHFKLPIPFSPFEKPSKGQTKAWRQSLPPLGSVKHKQFFQLIEEDVGQLLENLNKYTESLKPAFTCIHERLKTVLLKTFEGRGNLRAEVYGSFATNLLLESSDMDICIFGFDRLDRKEAVDVLQTLSNNLEQLSWCTGVLCLRNASVPVIKLVNCHLQGS